MHKPRNCFHIFRCWARGCLPWSPIVFEWCSASWSTRATQNTSHDSWPHFHMHVLSFQKSPLQICRVSRRIDVCSMLQFHVHAEIANVKSHVVTLILCDPQCSHSETTRHTEWWRSLLPSTAHAFTYCHQLAVYGTSLKTFLYTYVCTVRLKYKVQTETILHHKIHNITKLYCID